MKKEVQHYALNERNDLVNIKDVSKATGPFYCPHCHEEMICRQGEVREWHFAHKTKECGYDQYLHALAERRICDWYNQAEKVEICVDYWEKCKDFNTCKWRDNICSEACKREETAIYNLKKWLPTCEQEVEFIKNGQKFRADLFCKNIKNEQNPLFIEVYVTHACEQPKCESGIKIIEVKIDSEADIDGFISQPIAESDKIVFHGFKPQEKFVEDHDWLPMQKFIYYASGKTFTDYRSYNCKNYLSIHRGELEITMFYDDSGVPDYFWQAGGFYAVANAVVQREFPQHRNCQICKWKAYDEMGNISVCKLYRKCGTKRRCSDNNPLECPYFSIDSANCAYMLNVYDAAVADGVCELWRR